MAKMRLKCGSPSEHAIQKAVIKWIRLQPHLEYLVMKLSNEGKRSLSYGKQMKDEGLLPGAFDLFISIPSHGFHGAWIELKSVNGVLSLEQHKFKRAQEEVGFFCEVCYSIEEALDTISWYLNGY